MVIVSIQIYHEEYNTACTMLLIYWLVSVQPPWWV